MSDAHDYGMLIKIRCGLCKETHHYFAADVIKLIGDLPMWDIAPASKCEKCQPNSYLRADWRHVYGPDVGTITVRKLVRVRKIQIPVWKDETV